MCARTSRNGKVKVELALARGKQLLDKRETETPQHHRERSQRSDDGSADERVPHPVAFCGDRVGILISAELTDTAPF